MRSGIINIINVSVKLNYGGKNFSNLCFFRFGIKYLFLEIEFFVIMFLIYMNDKFSVFIFLEFVRNSVSL